MANLFGNPTSVDEIVSEFTKTVEKLEKHADAQAAAIAKHEAVIAAATAAKDAATVEQNKACAVALKIKALLS